MATIVAVTDENYQEEVESFAGLVVLDFWAEWCAPCKRLAPVLEAVANEFGDRLKVAKIDAEQHPRLAVQMNVRSLPTLLLLKDGQELDRASGFKSRDTLRSWLGQHLE